MRNISKVEPHDAVIRRLSIDYPKKSVLVDVAWYPEPGASKRRNATIRFKGVRSITHTADLRQLSKNALAGNVNYWVPAAKAGVTHIYLVDGIIAIWAQKVLMWFAGDV